MNKKEHNNLKQAKRCSKEVIMRGKAIKSFGWIIAIFSILFIIIYVIFKILSESILLNNNIMFIILMIFFISLIIISVGQLYFNVNNCYNEGDDITNE